MPDHRKNQALILVALLGVAAFAPLGGAQQQDGGARQKEHAKLYHYRTGKKLPQLAESGTGDVIVHAGRVGAWGISAGPHPPYPHLYLVDIASRADAVLLGVMKTSSSALTEDQDFIFTDWQMTVEEVLKDNPRASIALNTEITVTRPGGTLIMNGRDVRAIERTFLPFHEGGRYLLFLFFVPATGAYQAFNDESFELLEHGVRSARPNFPYVDLKTRQDPQVFLAEVRVAVAAAH